MEEQEKRITIFIVKGLDNPHYDMTVEKAVKKACAENVDIDINTRKAKITYSISKDNIIKSIRDAGYDIEKLEE